MKRHEMIEKLREIRDRLNRKILKMSFEEEKKMLEEAVKYWEERRKRISEKKK